MEMDPEGCNANLETKSKWGIILWNGEVKNLETAQLVHLQEHYIKEWAIQIMICESQL